MEGDGGGGGGGAPVRTTCGPDGGAGGGRTPRLSGRAPPAGHRTGARALSSGRRIALIKSGADGGTQFLSLGGNKLIDQLN